MWSESTNENLCQQNALIAIQYVYRVCQGMLYALCFAACLMLLKHETELKPI